MKNGWKYNLAADCRIIWPWTVNPALFWGCLKLMFYG